MFSLFRNNMHNTEKGFAKTTPVANFARSEDGSLLFFGVYVFIILLMFGGIGIDLMRVERDRAELQYTLDRAVLAAADLDQQLDPSDVVADYFEKAGLSEYLGNIVVDQGLSYREVSAVAKADVKTQFMHMTGKDYMIAPAASTAEERIDGVEISMVLDVSGSMNSNNRLYNLKIAARDFVDQMVDNTEEGKLSISIIPYATQVAMPDEFIAEFNTVGRNIYSNCINFEGTDFVSPAISTTQELQRTLHFDPWNDFDGRGRDPMELVRSPVCEEKDSRELVVLEKNRDTMKTFISNLTAKGNTSIDIGMKWGAALLDPSLQPVVSAMIDDGLVSDDFSARPHRYEDGETLKVVVLMTDGQNTNQYYLENDFRSGQSNIWWNEQEEEYSVYIGLDVDDEDNDGDTEEPLFFWPMDDTWHDHAYGEGTYDETTTEQTDTCISFRRNGSCRRYQTVETTVTVDEPGTAEIVTYPELWAWTSMEAVVEDLYEPWMNDSQAWNDWYYSARNYVRPSEKDNRVNAICNATKNKNVIVFTIGFEAPQHGLDLLRNCASSDAHFFDVEGGGLSEAFSSIASSIRKLRLTQ